MKDAHAVGFRRDRSLSELVIVCTNNDSDFNELVLAREQLKRFSTLEMVKSLEDSLTSNDSSTRRLAVVTLVWLVQNQSSSFTAEALSVLMAFFCGRLSDWASVEPSVQGIKSLYELYHETLQSLPSWPSVDEKKDRHDLSLLLGCASTSDLPVGNGTMFEKVLTKLLINVHAPSFGQSVRLCVLELIHFWLCHNYWSDSLVQGLSIQGEDERDPACILELFKCIACLPPQSTITSYEELFETCITPYFPLKLVGDNDAVSMQTLVESFHNALLPFGTRSVDYLLSFFSDSAKTEPCYLALIHFSEKRPMVVIHALLPMRRLPAPLVCDVWKRAVENLSGEETEELIVNLVQTGDEDALVLVAETKAFGQVVCSLLVHSNEDFVWNVLPKIPQTFCPTGPFCELITRLVNTTKPNLKNHFETIIHLIPYLQAVDPELVQMCVSTGKGLANLFEFHFAASLELNLENLKEFPPSELSRIVSALYVNQSELFDVVISSLHEQGLIHCLEYNTRNGLADRVWSLCQDFAVCRPNLLNNLENAELATELAKLCIEENPNVVSQLDSNVLHQLWKNGEEFMLFVPRVNEPKCVLCLSRVASEYGCTGEFLNYFKNCQNSPIWAAAVFEFPPELWAEDLTLDRLEALHSRGLDCVSAFNSLDLTKLTREAKIGVLFFLNDVEKMTKFESEMILSIETGGLMIFRLIAKYLFLNKTIRREFIDQLIGALVDAHTLVGGLSNAQKPGIRFASMQLLAIIPETVPVGKLNIWKLRVLQFLKNRLNIETKLIVRKQIAIAITNWLNC